MIDACEQDITRAGGYVVWESHASRKAFTLAEGAHLAATSAGRGTAQG